MKRIAILLLTMVLLFSFAGCGSAENGNKPPDQSSATAGENNALSGEADSGLFLDDITGTYSMNTYYDGREQQHTVTFTKSGDKLVASSDAEGEEPFELSYDPVTGTASYIQKIPHEDDEITVETTYIFTIEGASIKVTGKANATFKGDAQELAQYEGHKAD